MALSRLFRKILLLGLLVLCSNILIILLVYFPDQSGFNAAIIDKHRIIKEIDSPRLVFVGGSSLAFGLDSESVEKQLGINVVNMGLRATFGLRYILQEVKPYIKSGDTIVIVPEYQQFYGMQEGTSELFRTIINSFPQGLRYVSSFKQCLAFFSDYPNFIRLQIIRSLRRASRKNPEDFEDPVYCRSCFNQNGDVISHLTRQPKDITRLSLFPKDIKFSPGSVDLLNDFYSYALSKGARVFVIFPSIPRGQYEKERTRLDGLYSQLKNTLKIAMLSTPSDGVYPEDYFFDTVYHLNIRGREHNTAGIIRGLSGNPNIAILKK